MTIFLCPHCGEPFASTSTLCPFCQRDTRTPQLVEKPPADLPPPPALILWNKHERYWVFVCLVGFWISAALFAAFVLPYEPPFRGRESGGGFAYLGAALFGLWGFNFLVGLGLFAWSFWRRKRPPTEPWQFPFFCSVLLIVIPQFFLYELSRGLSSDRDTFFHLLLLAFVSSLLSLIAVARFWKDQHPPPAQPLPPEEWSA